MFKSKKQYMRSVVPDLNISLSTDDERTALVYSDVSCESYQSIGDKENQIARIELREQKGKYWKSKLFSYTPWTYTLFVYPLYCHQCTYEAYFLIIEMIIAVFIQKTN